MLASKLLWLFFFEIILLFDNVVLLLSSKLFKFDNPYCCLFILIISEFNKISASDKFKFEFLLYIGNLLSLNILFSKIFGFIFLFFIEFFFNYLDFGILWKIVIL